MWIFVRSMHPEESSTLASNRIIAHALNFTTQRRFRETKKANENIMEPSVVIAVAIILIVGVVFVAGALLFFVTAMRLLFAMLAVELKMLAPKPKPKPEPERDILTEKDLLLRAANERQNHDRQIRD